jgi:mannose/fructose-specific phosphotransferase system component IIA
MNGSNIEVIAAVNLPMLIKLASVRETSSLEQAVMGCGPQIYLYCEPGFGC